MKSPSPRKWYQFSLREILLAMVAVCAVASHFVNKPEEPPIVPALAPADAKKAVKSVCEEANLLVIESPGTFTSTIGGDWNSEHIFEIRGTSLSEFRQNLMPKIEGRLNSAISLTSNSRMTGLGGKPGILSDFRIEYAFGATSGVVRVYTFDRPDGSIQLLLILDEWK